MKKLKSLLKILNLLIVHLTILSLIQNPFVNANMVYAADSSSSSTRITADDVQKVSSIFLNAANSYLNAKQSIIQAQIAAANNQKMMSQFGPNCRRPDGSPCYSSQAKYFPECTLPASMSNMPQNVCTKPTPDSMQIGSMINFEAIAQGWTNYYDQMLNEASNAAYPAGLRCLKDKQKGFDSSLTEMINSLQRLQDRLNQDKQVFRDNNKKLLEEMNSANDELFGTGKGDLKNKTADMSKLFSPTCQTVISKELLSKAKVDGGLNGLLQNVSPISKAAGDFNQNRSIIENDIRQEANKIASSISKNGVGDFITNGYIPQSEEAQKSFGNAIKIQMMKQAKEFETAKKRIDATLAEVGYTAPALSSNFSVDMEEFMAGSNNFFKKKYINECVTGADRGIAIPVDQILKSLQQKSTNSEGTARNDYRDALKNVLDSDAMIQDKMDRIKALEAGYPDITVTYKDSNKVRKTVTPYELFMETISRCEQTYSQGDQFTASGAKGGNSVSYQKKVERARAALQELKNLNDSYASKVTGTILSQVLDCGGSAAKAGKCSAETLDSSKDNFCVSHASECANQIQGCYAEVEKHVQTRKAKMENLAKTFNANVAAMIAKSNSYYEQQKAAVANMTTMIQSKFPGTNFEIPKDMFVTMPELKKDKFGVELAADGDLKEILEGEGSMPKRIDKLKDMFAKQKETVNTQLDEYISLQKSAMEKQQGRWKELANECKRNVDQSTALLEKINSEGQKKQAEDDSNMSNFCSKYSSLSENPLGACDDVKDLASDMNKVANRLDSSVGKNINAFKKMCNQYNNESDAGSNSSSNSSKANTIAAKKAKKSIGNTSKMCLSDKKVKNDNDAFLSALKKASPELRKAVDTNNDNVIKYLLGGNVSVETLSKDEDTVDMLKQLQQKISNAKTKKYDDLLGKFSNSSSSNTEGRQALDALGIKNDESTNLCDALIKDLINSNSGLKKAEDVADLSDKDDSPLGLIKSSIEANADYAAVSKLEDDSNNLGQKISGAPCEAQNKSTMAKGFQSMWDVPSGFDQSILGKSK